MVGRIGVGGNGGFVSCKEGTKVGNGSVTQMDRGGWQGQVWTVLMWREEDTVAVRGELVAVDV